MTILFCNDAFAPKSVDPDFEDEFSAAAAQGFTTHLFSFESLTKDAEAARNIKAANNLQDIIYRGWMLKPQQYTLLYETLLAKNFKLINSPTEYQNCHYLPHSYQFIEKHTPKTVWTRQTDFEKIFEIIEPFGNAPLIVKDFVKSQKHYWDSACFIPSAADKDKVKSVISKFVELQGNDLNEGLVIREFVELQDLTTHSKSGMPLKQEYRLFFYKGNLLGCYDYWEEGEYAANEQPPLPLFIDIAKNVQSNFFSMDIAKTKNGEWIIIELGDGQVAGLPGKADRQEFYRAL